jgi:hypothetical protein
VAERRPLTGNELKIILENTKQVKKVNVHDMASQRYDGIKSLQASHLPDEAKDKKIFTK